MPLESAAVQLGCSEFIFAFLLELFLARDTGWTIAAGKSWCDHNLECLPPARPLCPPNTLTWGPSREVEFPHQFSSLRTPRFDSALAPLSSGPSRLTILSITPCVLFLPSSPRNFARSLDPFPCLSESPLAHDSCWREMLPCGLCRGQLDRACPGPLALPLGAVVVSARRVQGCGCLRGVSISTSVNIFLINNL